MGYYGYTPDLSLEEISARWQAGDKLYDCHTQLPNGPYFCGWYDWETLWPYREDDRRLNPELLAAIEVEGFLEPVHLIFGANGGIRMGEGNHRIQVARALDIPLPVQMHFYSETYTPTDETRRRRARGLPPFPEPIEPPSPELERILEQRKQRRVREWIEREVPQEVTPEHEAAVEEILDLLPIGFDGLHQVEAGLGAYRPHGPAVCNQCGVRYQDFRSGWTFADAYEHLAWGQPHRPTTKQILNHLWRMKQDEWDRHLDNCAWCIRTGCESCATMPDGATFCGHCGERLPGPDVQYAPEEFRD